MSRYIDESILVEKLHVGEGLPTISRSVLVNCVLPTIPTADVRENIKGEWIEKNDVFRCSVCGKEALWSERIGSVRTDYCPNCGAQMMRGEA